jgi:hypothetical protein
VKVFAAIILLSFFSLNTFSQTAPQPVAEVVKKAPSRTSKKSEPAKPPNDKETYGKKLLEMAEADAGDIRGGTRAYVLLQIARAYEKDNKAKAIELLENALMSTRVMDDDKVFRTRSRLQKEILNALVPLAPERVDELLTQVDTEARGEVLTSLLEFYERSKQLDRVIEVLYRTAQEQEIPYDAVARCMGALPAEKSGQGLQLFTTALNSYRDHDHRDTGITFGGTIAADFPSLIVQYWQQLPPAVATEAIDEVLKQAEPKGDSGSQHDSLAIASAKGSLSFGSTYEYLLFQLLPVLKQLDPDRADKLLKKYQQVEALIAAHPNGAHSLLDSPAAQGDAGTPKRVGGFAVFGAGAGPEAKARMTASMQERERANQIVEDSEAHPQDALAQVSSIADLEARASALEGIARANVKKNSTVAKAALRELIELAAKLNGVAQTRSMNSSAALLLQVGDPDGAKKAIEKGIAGAENMYKQDSDADDPNKAIKAYWPSTQAYAVLLRTAGRISPDWAMAFLEQMPDLEVRAAAEVSLASAWLNLPGGLVTTITLNKRSPSLSMQYFE